MSLVSRAQRDCACCRMVSEMSITCGVTVCTDRCGALSVYLNYVIWNVLAFRHLLSWVLSWSVSFRRCRFLAVYCSLWYRCPFVAHWIVFTVQNNVLLLFVCGFFSLTVMKPDDSFDVLLVWMSSTNKGHTSTSLKTHTHTHTISKEYLAINGTWYYSCKCPTTTLNILTAYSYAVHTSLLLMQNGLLDFMYFITVNILGSQRVHSICWLDLLEGLVMTV